MYHAQVVGVDVFPKKRFAQAVESTSIRLPLKLRAKYLLENILPCALSQAYTKSLR
jgi:hypothetical protein